MSIKSALRSDTIYALKEELKKGGNCPVCDKPVRKGDPGILAHNR